MSKKEWVNIHFKIEISYVKQSFADQNRFYKTCKGFRDKKKIGNKRLNKYLGLKTRSRITLTKIS